MLLLYDESKINESIILSWRGVEDNDKISDAVIALMNGALLKTEYERYGYEDVLKGKSERALKDKKPFTGWLFILVIILVILSFLLR
jgi:hypothetical protein